MSHIKVIFWFMSCTILWELTALMAIFSRGDWMPIGGFLAGLGMTISLISMKWERA